MSQVTKKIDNSEGELIRSYERSLGEITETLGSAWQVFDRHTSGLTWRSFVQIAKPPPKQGWKIHVSLAAVEALALFDFFIPLLIKRGVSFKIPATVDGIAAINFGEAGPTQIGKIITIYPGTDDEAAALAMELDHLWPKSRGPAIPSDLTIREGGAVALRYGAFGGGDIIVDSIGRPSYAIRLPDGTLTEDKRSSNSKQPDWAPMLSVPLVTPKRQNPIEEVALNGKRYLPLALLYEGPISKVVLGLDVDTCLTIVMKSVDRGLGCDIRGYDARTKLLNEYSVLMALSEFDELGPRPLGMLDGDSALLITEDLGGEPLVKRSRVEQVRNLPLLARAVALLHQLGYAHRDIKLSNVLMTDGVIRLIDFGLADRLGSEVAPLGGTGGHVAPEGSHRLVSAAGDVYALGACVAHALLHCDPASLPRNGGRLIGLLHLTGSHVGARIVKRLIDANPTQRITASEAANLLAENCDILVKGSEPDSNQRMIRTSKSWYKRAVWSAAVATKHYVQKAENGHWWQNFHFLAAYACEGINLGASGIILGLASIDQAFGRTCFNDDISNGANWLISREPQPYSAGLFTGDAGVALSLGVAAKRLARPELFRSARARLVAAASTKEEYDLFCGAAGVLFAGCLLSDITEEDWPLDVVKDKAEFLLDKASVQQGVIVWPASKGLDASNAQFTGSAHGSAGIAMALAVWGKRVRDRRYVDLAKDTFRSVRANATVDDGATIKIRLDESSKRAPIGGWCHGVAGYLWCLLQGLADEPSLREEIDWAYDLFAEATLHAVDNTTYCHGLSGMLELWRMLAGLPRYRDVAESRTARTAAMLRLLHQRIEGETVWCSDDPRVITPDLWVGFLGPATALALYAIDSHDALLSARWLRTCAGHRL